MKNRICSIILASCLIAGMLSQTVCGAGLSLNLLSAVLSSIEENEDSLFDEILEEPAEEVLPDVNVPVIEEESSNIEEPDFGQIPSDAGLILPDAGLLLPDEGEVPPEEEIQEEVMPGEEFLDVPPEDALSGDEPIGSFAEEFPGAIEEELAEELPPTEDAEEENIVEDSVIEPDKIEVDDDADADKEGRYVFDGYLEDGIPNYVWEGEGRPSVLGDEIILPKENFPELSTPEEDTPDLSTLEEDIPKLTTLKEDIFETVIPQMRMQNIWLTGISPTSEGGNYLADPVKRKIYHSNKSFSEKAESEMKDGLHTIGPGMVRAYKGGKYFIDGGFALDGKKYYADESGLLIGGWLKTVGDSSVEDPNSVANDKKFSFRYFDRESYVMQTGRINVDGLWHYFSSDGKLLKDSAVTLEGNYYYSDHYGICEQVKLRYGNTLISEENQNNDTYKANKSVNAVDINTFTGQKGEYSFRPRWYPGVSSLELFGFPEMIEDLYGWYCPLSDNSLQGSIGCIYRKVGRYKGREMDLKVIVTGYDLFSLCGDTEIGYFYVYKKNIGLNTVNTKNLTADLIFLDHETGREVSVKGYATFTDIDIGQTVSVLSPVDEIFVDKDCVLYKDPASNTFTSPFIAKRIGSVVNDNDREYWVQVNFTGSRLSIRIGSAYEQYVFAESGLDIAGESRNIWRDNYTGDPHSYSLFDSTGALLRGWQGIYYKKLGRVSIPPVAKTVSDEDEIDVTKNRLRDDELRYNYTLSHNVPGENEEFFYDSYMVSDDFEDGLVIDKDGIFVTTDNEDDVTGLFDISVVDRRVEFRAHPDILKDASFYDNNYNYHIPVVIREVEGLKNKDKNDYIIYNECSAEFSRLGSSESTRSNMTETRIRIPVSFGSITITKRIKEADIVWAHGNPAFLFRAEGEDEKGKFHRYEEFLCFRKGGYSLTGDGFAEISVTIAHVPCGTYRVTELPVMDYYLTGAEAATKNMLITTVGEPGKGKDPSLTAYGTGTLSREEPDAGIIFYDTKGNYSGYRHTDVVCNSLPLTLD